MPQTIESELLLSVDLDSQTVTLHTSEESRTQDINETTNRMLLWAAQQALEEHQRSASPDPVSATIQRISSLLAPTPAPAPPPAPPLAPVDQSLQVTQTDM